MSELPREAPTAELIEPRPGESMDWPKLVDHLRAHYDESLSATVDVEQFAGGHANLTYCLRFADRELVLRRAPLGPVAKGAHDMAREYRVLSKLHRGYDRAPRALYFCDDESVIGAPFFLAERRLGVVVRRHWPESLRDLPQVERRVSFALVDALADLHKLSPEALGLDRLGRPEGFVERQVKGWAARWHAAKDRDIAVFDEIHQTLDANPTPQHASVDSA